jgi:hypothetical protein
MMKLRILALLAAFAMATGVHAEEATTTSASTSKTKVKKKAGDIDEEITNAKMRAEMGSKSKWSFSSSLSYSGGPIEQIQSKNRPNLDNDPIAPVTTLGGDVGVRYRVDKRSSISAGVGISAIQPFHAPQKDVPGVKGGHKTYFDKFQVDDPYASYTYAKKFGQVQTVLSGTLGFGTSQQSQDSNYVVGGNAAANMKWTPKGSNLTLGLLLSATKNVYSSRVKTPKGFANYTDWTAGVYPIAEYAFTDSVIARTVFWGMRYRNLQDDDTFTLTRLSQGQSVGLGFAVTRDIFLYPNMQFYWADVSASNPTTIWNTLGKNSTFGISANISLF